MDKALLVDISYTEEPYAVRIDPAQLAKQPDGTYHIEGGSPGAHASSHAAGGSDPVTLSMSQVSGLSAAIAPLGTSTSAATPSTLALRDAAGAAEFAGLSVDTTPTVVQTGAPGKLIWNETDGTLEFQLKGGNVTLQLGQEQVLRVRNAEATTLVDGEVVYLAGSSGTHNNVRRADANLESTSAITIGVVTEPISAHPGEGYITTFGLVACNTNHLTEGAAVWLSTVAGETTATRPTAPDHAVLVGFCVKKAGAADGRLFVTVNNGYELSELHDVLIGAQAEGDVLVWDNTTKVWRNKVPSTQPWVLKAGDTMAGPLVVNGSLSTTGAITTQTQLEFDAVADPTSAVTLALIASTGNVNVGAHYYFVSFVTALGETALYLGALASITTSAGNQQVLISNIPVSADPRVTARRIYRTGAGQPYYSDVRILATINDNVTTTYTDNLSDASRTGAANCYLRENTTCRFLVKDGAAAGFFGKNFTVFGLGAAATLFAGTASGGGNTCLGYEAGKSLSSGDQNIIISNAATAISTGTSNVLIHGNWGNNPSNSVLIGRNAGAQNSGTGNVGIGYSAAPSGHNYCVSMGSYANNNVNGNGCTALGYYAGYQAGASAGAYNINIGCAVTSPSGATSGQLNIGNVLYGVNLHQSTTVSSTPTTAGSLGVCVASPTARLQLPAGAAAAGRAPLKVTPGVNLTVPEDGAVEYDGADFSVTVVTTRYKLALVVPPVTKAFADSPYTVAATDRTILCNAVAGAMTINLPTAAQAGRRITVKKVDSSAFTVTIDGTAAQMIDGDLTQELTTRNAAITMEADGSNWWIV